MPRKPFRVGRSRTGLGLFATKPIKKRAWIAEAMGVEEAGLLARFSAAAAAPLESKVVAREDAPCQQVVHTNGIDLHALLPIPTTSTFWSRKSLASTNQCECISTPSKLPGYGGSGQRGSQWWPLATSRAS